MNTSYFNNINHIKNPVSISAINPDWYHGNWYPKLAPPVALVRRYKSSKMSKTEYEKIYYSEVLNNLDPRSTYLELIDLFGEDAVLLCYETPKQFCHRKLVSKWLYNTIGVKIEELC